MYLNSIPIDLFLKCIPYLDVSDIISLSIASKETYTLCKDNLVWRELYINRKKVEFYKKEKNIVREMVLSPNGLEQDLCFDSPIKVTLRIKNISDTTYSYSYVYRASSGNSPEWIKKKYGIIDPYSNRIIHSYVNHRWLITPSYFHPLSYPTDNVYKSLGFLIKSTDIHPYPIKYKINDGTIKEYENVVNIIVGEPYDSISSNEIVKKKLPRDIREFSDFRKRFLKSNIKVVKGKLRDCDNGLRGYKYLLNKEQRELESLQNKINKRKEVIKYEEDKSEKMKDFLKYVKGL